MRKITKEAINAFEQGGSYKGTNTTVSNGILSLFGNRIAFRSPKGSLFISNAGWDTSTTKERLNAIEGVHIQQKAGKWYLNSREWSGGWVKVNQITGEWTYNY